MKQRRFFVVLLSAILAFPLLAGLLLGQARLAVKPGAVSQVDETLAQMARDGRFSGSVLIAQDGVVLLSEGYGLADRAQGIPITPQTRFHLGSLSKQFTALGILILESQGKLSVQDPICNFIASCPPEWRGITIHHLLTHTSGLSSDQSSTLYGVIMSTQSGLAAPAEQAKYLGFTIRWFLDSPPGDQHAYSNFGYILLAYIIEQVSGQSYGDYLNQAIFTPLNMRNTGYEDGPSGVALAYRDKDTLVGEQYGSYPVPDGSDNLYSTGPDLLLWDQALYTDQLLPRAQLEPLYTPFVRESELPGFGHGYGWFVTRLLGRPILMGTGGGPAFTTIYFRLPADGLTLIVLANQADADPIGTMTALVLTMAGKLFLSDLVLTLTAVACILLLAVLLAAQEDRRVKTTWVLGILWLLLAVPLALVFSRYLAERRGLWTLLPLSLVLLYMLVKALVDLLFRIDFRRNRIAHLAYLTLQGLALFSLVWIAFRIHPFWAIPVLIALGILLVSQFFTYRNKIPVRKSHTVGGSL